MAMKQILPNQCTPLHFIYGAPNCCLCDARRQMRELAQNILDAVNAEQLAEPDRTEGDRGYTYGLRDALRAIRRVCYREGIELNVSEDGDEANDVL